MSHSDQECRSESPEEECLEMIDLNAFAVGINTLGKMLEQEQHDDNVRHLNKMIMWINLVAVHGLLTMGISVKIFSIIALSTLAFRAEQLSPIIPAH